MGSGGYVTSQDTRFIQNAQQSGYLNHEAYSVLSIVRFIIITIIILFFTGFPYMCIQNSIKNTVQLSFYLFVILQYQAKQSFIWQEEFFPLLFLKDHLQKYVGSSPVIDIKIGLLNTSSNSNISLISYARFTYLLTFSI